MLDNRGSSTVTSTAKQTTGVAAKGTKWTGDLNNVPAPMPKVLDTPNRESLAMLLKSRYYNGPDYGAQAPYMTRAIPHTYGAAMQPYDAEYDPEGTKLRQLLAWVDYNNKPPHEKLRDFMAGIPVPTDPYGTESPLTKAMNSRPTYY